MKGIRNYRRNLKLFGVQTNNARQPIVDGYLEVHSF